MGSSDAGLRGWWSRLRPPSSRVLGQRSHKRSSSDSRRALARPKRLRLGWSPRCERRVATWIAIASDGLWPRRQEPSLLGPNPAEIEELIPKRHLTQVFECPSIRMVLKMTPVQAQGCGSSAICVAAQDHGSRRSRFAQGKPAKSMGLRWPSCRFDVSPLVNLSVIVRAGCMRCSASGQGASTNLCRSVWLGKGVAYKKHTRGLVLMLE